MNRSAKTLEYRAAELELGAAKAEIELLASIADGPRQGIAILCEMAIGLDHFCNLDARAIYLVLAWAGDLDGPPRDKLQIVTIAAALLRRLGFWDGDDSRHFVTGSRWGPGPLATLLTRIDFDPELVRLAARNLLAVNNECQHMLASTTEGGRRCA